MDGAILYLSYGIGSFGSTVAAKINRVFYKIGYTRAAAELRKLGYLEEAKRCMMEVKKLKS